MFCVYCAFVCTCTSLSELLLRVSPRLGMFAPERAVARSFSTLGLCVSLSELLLGVSPRLGMFAPERAVAMSFSTLRLIECIFHCDFVCMYALTYIYIIAWLGVQYRGIFYMSGPSYFLSRR